MTSRGGGEGEHGNAGKGGKDVAIEGSPKHYITR